MSYLPKNANSSILFYLHSHMNIRMSSIHLSMSFVLQRVSHHLLLSLFPHRNQNSLLLIYHLPTRLKIT